MQADEYEPGEPAPRTGEYEELNVLGARTGWAYYVRKGDALPLLPRGFKWRHVPAWSASQLLRRTANRSPCQHAPRR
jgi:hypothetical protein